MPLISVIVPIYNASMYLSYCIDSLLKQNFKDIEIILVDDGSTDGSSQICDKYKERYSKIRVVHKSNEGLVKARKDGYKISQGEYITFVDADDWIEPDMLNKLSSSALKENVDIVMCGHYEDIGTVHREVRHGIAGGRYDKNALRTEVYPHMIENGGFFEWGIIPTAWGKLFRRECIEPFLMTVDENITMGEDAACVYPSLLNADSISIQEDCIYHYRQTASSMIKSHNDITVERNRFKILYKSGLNNLERCKSSYNISEQWRDYVLFMMIPRADTLYDGIDELEYLFPFPKVRKGSRVIIYCAGTYGQRLFHYLIQTGFCEVVALADRNYVELNKQGIPAVSPDSMQDYNFDDIVIASSFAKTRKAIYNELIGKFPKEKVHVMDEKLIRNERTLKAFGLI